MSRLSTVSVPRDCSSLPLSSGSWLPYVSTRRSVSSSSFASWDVGWVTPVALRSTGRASAYGTTVWHETHVVVPWPVRSFFALSNHKSIRSSRYFAAASLSQAVGAFRTVDANGIGWDDAGSAEAARADDMHTASNGRANTDPKDFIGYPVAPGSLPVKTLLLTGASLDRPVPAVLILGPAGSLRGPWGGVDGTVG